MIYVINDERPNPMIDEISRIPVIILGRKLGTASGWDQPDHWAICFYDFAPDSNPDKTTDICLNVEFNRGVYELYKGEGSTPYSTGPLVNFVMDYPLASPEELESL